MEGITGLTIYTVIIIFLPVVLYCLFIYRERIKLFFSFLEEIGILIIFLIILMRCYVQLITERIVLKYKKIKRSISCYSFKVYKKIIYFLLGEKILLKNAIIISILEDKSFKAIDTSSNNVIFALRLQEITDYYIYIMGQGDLIKIPFSSVDDFFPGMKVNIVCKKYWFDKNLYFLRFA